MIRGLSIELRGHIDDPMWASFWDAVFFVGSSLLAVFFGAALGNVVRGVPLDADGYFFQPLWTDFSPFSDTPGILDWYTVLIGLLALDHAHRARLELHRRQDRGRPERPLPPNSAALLLRDHPAHLARHPGSPSG